MHLAMLSLKKSRQRFLLSLFRMSSLTLVIMEFITNRPIRMLNKTNKKAPSRNAWCFFHA